MTRPVPPGINPAHIATVAQDIADAVDPRLAEDQRVTAAEHALAVSPTLAVSMSTVLAQRLIELVADLGVSTDSVMAVVHASIRSAEVIR